jgi:K+-transporting ATPase A subunit
MSLVAFNALCVLSAYALLRVQSVHPLNPHDFHAMPWAVIALQSFLSMAAGLALAIGPLAGELR